MSKRETSSEIDDAAALWAMRIDDAVLDDEKQADFEYWLQGDIRRVGAFARAQAVLVQAKRAMALGAPVAPVSLDRVRDGGRASDRASDNDRLEPIPPAVDERAEPGGVMTRRRLLIGASAVAASGAFALILPTQRAAAQVYATGRGETRVVPLRNGAQVTLNTQSKIAVTLDGPEQRVQFLQGEALFDVAMASSADFIVEAGDTSLRAHNAMFVICQLDERPLEVKVCNGDVDVARGGFLARRTRRLHADVQATMPADGSIVETSVSPGVFQRGLAWQDGMLSFEDTPLRQAADEFARYSDRRIEIADQAVGAETVTGLYAANNPQGFAQAVALSLNLHMQMTASGIILSR